MSHSEDIAIKFAIELRNRRKRWFLGPRFVGEGIPQILDMHFQTYSRPCGRIWLSSVQRARRLDGEKEEERIPVKLKSADTLAMSGGLTNTDNKLN